MYYFTLVPMFALIQFLHVYCVRRWGGSPGKLLCGLRIVKTSLEPAGWKEALLRESVNLAFWVADAIVHSLALGRMTDGEFAMLGSQERDRRTAELSGGVGSAMIWIQLTWIWGELLILLTNSRRRALHDFIAGTLVIRK